MNKAQVFEFFRRLAEDNPAPTTELEYTNPYTLLVAVVLSAQATDASVNLATRELFKRVTDARSRWSSSARMRCASAIKTIGLFNTKAKNVIALSEALLRDHGGEVPRTREALQALPGVGPQDRQRRPQHRLGRGDVRGRHPRLPGLQPHRPRARQDGRRCRSQARKAACRSRSAATPTTG